MLVMVALDMVAFGIIAPVLPDLIRQFEGGDLARAAQQQQPAVSFDPSD